MDNFNFEKLISRAAGGIKSSGIRKYFDLAETMPDCVSLGIGEPDFITPYHIREAGMKSLREGHTHYTSNSGMLELRKEISKYLAQRFTLEYSPEEIVVTVGGSEAIDLCMRSIINPGDEVLIPEPSFVCYAPIAALCGGIPVILNTDETHDFRLTGEELRSKITDRSKLLILPYPNNPTGAIMTRSELEEIAGILRGTDIAVLSDELYAELTYEGNHLSIASVPGMYERTVIVSGFSKAFAMTGWRIGYAAGPESIIKIMLKVHQYAIMSAPTTAQHAAAEALRNGCDDVKYMKEEYNSRRIFLINSLKKLGISCFTPLGGFYAFPSIKKFGLSSEEFCSRLIREEHCAFIPGTAFGNAGEGYIRLSYAYSVEDIEKALIRLEKFISRQ